MDSGRLDSLAGRLARLGFGDPAQAVRQLESAPLAVLLDQVDVVDAFGAAADPDLALRTLGRICDAASIGEKAELVAAVIEDAGLRARLIGVVGLSGALGDHIVRHPEHWRVLREPMAIDQRPNAGELREELLRAVGADPAADQPCASSVTPRGIRSSQLLRQRYHRLLLALAARDLVGNAPLDEVAGQLSDMADGALETCLAIARSELPPDAAPCQLAVIAMGKCGGRELNYVSDVDVVFVAEPNDTDSLATATALARGLMTVAQEATADGALWQVDAALRPEGKSGALVRTLASHLAYYARWAATWEFQALLKARPAAGDMDLGRAYADGVLPLVWSAADRDGFVADVQSMRRRVEKGLPSGEAEREIKLGAGGLRDVEFSVQLLQLVHGRSDVMLRSPTTLTALNALATWGYVGRHDAAELSAAYRFLRRLEHRMQLVRLQRTHLVPEDSAALRQLGRSMGFREQPVENLLDTWKSHARVVRRIHEKLFYRPLLDAVARLAPGDARLTRSAAEARLMALGYTDPDGALRHIAALTSGVSRRAAIQRTLLPVLLGWFADAPDPDAGLLTFRRVSDALGGTPWFLRLLRDESSAAQRMARVLATSRYAADLLIRTPEAVTLFADFAELTPTDSDALRVEIHAAASRHENPQDAIMGVRAARGREILRIAIADTLGMLGVEDVGRGLSNAAEAAIAAALDIAIACWVSEHHRQFPTQVAVIGMGRLGGCELGYSSDVDLMFVHNPLPGVPESDATKAALSVVNNLRRLLTSPTADLALEIDVGLRPEGRDGPLVRTLASYRAYYQRWSSAWEAQALLRARVVAGDAALGAGFTDLIDPLRWSTQGVSDDDLREIRRLKARMESERLPRGADPALHLKLGRGGLSDVEWVAQLTQLRHGADYPALRTTHTLTALRAAADVELVSHDDAHILSQAWSIASAVRNAVTLVTGRPGDQIPTDGRVLAGVAHILGYNPDDRGRLTEDYLRITRQARAVVERLFYGWD